MILQMVCVYFTFFEHPPQDGFVLNCPVEPFQFRVLLIPSSQLIKRESADLETIQVFLPTRLWIALLIANNR